MSCKVCAVRRYQVRLHQIEVARLARQLGYAKTAARTSTLQARIVKEKAQLTEARGYLVEHEAECGVTV